MPQTLSVIWNVATDMLSAPALQEPFLVFSEKVPASQQVRLLPRALIEEIAGQAMKPLL